MEALTHLTWDSKPWYKQMLPFYLGCENYETHDMAIFGRVCVQSCTIKTENVKQRRAQGR